MRGINPRDQLAPDWRPLAGSTARPKEDGLASPSEPTARAQQAGRRAPAPMPLPKLLIFGMDGTLRRPCGEHRPSEGGRFSAGERTPISAVRVRENDARAQHLMPHVAEVLACYPLRAAGRGEMAVGIVSNQDAVARGELSHDTCEQRLWETVYQALGVRPADVFFGHRLAPGRQSSEPPLTLLFCAQLAPDHLMRLPNPGMLDVLLERHDVMAHDALMVGVHPDEATAAYLARVPFVAAWDFFGWPDPPRPLLHGHRCDVCGRYLTLTCHCLDPYRYGLCETCEQEG